MTRNSLMRSKFQNAAQDAITCLVMVAFVAFVIWAVLEGAYWVMDHLGKVAYFK